MCRRGIDTAKGIGEGLLEQARHTCDTTAIQQAQQVGDIRYRLAVDNILTRKRPGNREIIDITCSKRERAHRVSKDVVDCKAE